MRVDSYGMTKYVMSQYQLDVLTQRALMACCQAHEAGFQRFRNANLWEVADALFHSSLRVLAVFPGPDAHTIRNSSKIDKQFFCVFPARLAVARADIRTFYGVVRDERNTVEAIYPGAFYGVDHGFVLLGHGLGGLFFLLEALLEHVWPDDFEIHQACRWDEPVFTSIWVFPMPLGYSLGRNATTQASDLYGAAKFFDDVF